MWQYHIWNTIFSRTAAAAISYAFKLLSVHRTQSEQTCAHYIILHFFYTYFICHYYMHIYIYYAALYKIYTKYTGLYELLPTGRTCANTYLYIHILYIAAATQHPKTNGKNKYISFQHTHTHSRLQPLLHPQWSNAWPNDGKSFWPFQIIIFCAKPLFAYVYGFYWSDGCLAPYRNMRACALICESCPKDRSSAEVHGLLCTNLYINLYTCNVPCAYTSGIYVDMRRCHP